MKSIVTALVDPSGAADYGPDAYVEIWSQLPVGAGGTIATDKPLRVPVTLTGLSTPPIRAGNYLIRMKLGTTRTALGPYPFTMPDGDGTTELWPLIAAGVNIPGDTPIQKIQEALAAYLVANPIDGNGLDQTAVDTRVQTVGDTRYVLIPTGGTDGQVLVKAGDTVVWASLGEPAREDGPLALQSAAYRAAAMNAGTTRLKILTIGDSTTDGFGNPGGPDQWSKAWPVRLAELMREHLSLPAGGRGWVPCMTPLDPGSYVYRVTELGPDGVTAVDTLSTQVGIPGSMWLQRGNGATVDEVTWTELSGVTSAQVVTTGYGPENSLILTPASGAVRTLDSTGDRMFTSVTNPGESLKVNPADGVGLAALGMVEYKGDETAGVTAYNLGQGSMAAHEYLNWMTQGTFSLKPLIGQIAPNIALICLGANDFQRGRPLQTVVENLGGLRMEIQAASPGTETVFVLRPIDPLATLEQTPAYTWDELCESVIAAAAGIGAPVLDLRDKVAASGTEFYINDRVHLTEAGNLAYANAVLDYMKVGS